MRGPICLNIVWFNNVRNNSDVSYTQLVESLKERDLIKFLGDFRLEAIFSKLRSSDKKVKIDESKKLEEKDVREMLGLMDKRKIILLLKEVFEGNQKNAVDYLQKIFNEGLDAKNFLNDVKRG